MFPFVPCMALEPAYEDSLILDNTLDIANVINMVFNRTFDDVTHFNAVTVLFKGIKGIDVGFDNSQLRVNSIDQMSTVTLMFHRSKFAFYSKGEEQRLETTCHENMYLRPERAFRFSMLLAGTVDFSRPVCPYFFRDAKMSYIQVDGLVDTFLQRNLFEFYSDRRTRESDESSFNSDIYLLVTSGFNYELNSKLLHK